MTTRVTAATSAGTRGLAGSLPAYVAAAAVDAKTRKEIKKIYSNDGNNDCS